MIVIIIVIIILMIQGLDYFNKPFFLRVRKADALMLTRIFLPLTSRVRFWMFGLKTLRVLC